MSTARNDRSFRYRLLAPLAMACIYTAGCDENSDAAGSAKPGVSQQDAGGTDAGLDASSADAAAGDAGQSDTDADRSDAGHHDAGDADHSESGHSDSGQSDAGQQTGGAAKGHLVVVTERESPESALQYLHVLDAWPKDGKLDYSKAVELGEFVNVHALGDAIFVHQPEEAIVRKLVVASDGSVGDAVSVSFAGQGAVSSAGDMVYVSDTRAYFLDEASGQFVVWNPKTMEVEGSFDLDKAVLTRNTLPAQISRGISSGDQGFVSVSWRDWETLTYHDAAALGVFDAKSLEPKLRVLEDDRCASTVMPPYDGGDGFVYLVSDAALGFDALANPTRTQKKLCVLRTRPGSGELDKDFFVDLKEVLGSPGFYATHPMKGGKLLVNLWAPDVDLASVAKADDPNWYWEQPPYFEYAIVDLVKGTSTPVKGIARAAVQWSITLRVDGDTYVQTYREDEGSDLQRVDPDGKVTPVLANGPKTDVQYLGRVSK